jgi:hypothetical protein
MKAGARVSAAFPPSLAGFGVSPASLIPPRLYPARSCLIRCLHSCRKADVRPTSRIVLVQVCSQTLWIIARFRSIHCCGEGSFYCYSPVRTHRISTSRFGVGQREGSNKTPLGLHRIERKIGGGLPAGAVFKGRKQIGNTWQGMPQAAIAHRILWLRGLENGLNSGAGVDSFARYIYIHGVGDESTLGRPASCGCIHMAASDLLPFYDQTPVGTLVYIE